MLPLVIFAGPIVRFFYPIYANRKIIDKLLRSIL